MEQYWKVRCDRCGGALNPGDPAWRFHLTLTADTVQGVDGLDGESPADLNARIETLLARISEIPKDMLENEVYQVFHGILCRKCRDIIAANPLIRDWD